MITTATKDDLNRIYDKLEPMSKDIASIKMQLKMTPPPAARPCRELEMHLQEHRESKNTWKKSIISAVVDAMKMGTVGLVVYFFSKK